MRKKILVADVGLDTLDLIKIILEKHGYEVSTAPTSVEGVLKAKSELPDVILWDAAFGWEVCKTLKSQEETKHIPIVISTTLPITLDENSKKYADGHLQKPFKPNELLAELEKHLQ
jgi:CheY-like chemotaxis protein